MPNERMGRLYVRLIIILALIVIAALTLWQKRPPLGLDLKGGTELIYRVRMEDVAKDQQDRIVDQTIAVIKKRVDPDGTLELAVWRQGRDRFYIQLPSMDASDARRVEDLIRRAGKLRFCLVNTDPEDRRKALEGERIPNHLPFLPVVKDGHVHHHRKASYAELKELGPGAGNWMLVETTARVTGTYLLDPKVIRDERGLPAIGFAFKGKGRLLFERLTEENIGKPLAIILDEDLYSAPTIRSAISGDGQITGNFTLQEAEDLVAVLRAGSLPADIELMWNNTVGAELGEDSIRSGIRACVIGAALVVGFIALYYLLTGVVADFALALNILLILAFMAASRMVLTLPGLAGLALTVGMAVDANVLINERIREERERGKTLRLAIQSGYDRAFVTIIDSNLTTLITAIILFGVGTESVAGFAKTLSIGIIISMFTAIWVTRAIVDFLIEIGLLKALKMLPTIPRPHVPFSRVRHVAMAGSAVLILAGLPVFLHGYATERLLDTDLTGGFHAEMELRRGITVDEFRNRVKDIFDKPDVQSVWTAGEAASGDLPRRFAIRVRHLTAKQKTDKILWDLERMAERHGLSGSAIAQHAPVPLAKTPPPLRLKLGKDITEDELRAMLQDAGYGDGDINRIVAEDQEAKEFILRLRTAAMDPRKPDASIAEVLNALKPFIISQNVQIVKTGEISKTAPPKAGADSARVQSFLPITLGEACSTAAIREAIVREVLGGEERPEDLRVVGHGRDQNSEICRQVAIHASDELLATIRSRLLALKKPELPILSFVLVSSDQVQVGLEAKQTETALLDRLGEARLLVEPLPNGEYTGLVRAIVPKGVAGKVYTLYMRPLSEDKIKEKIRDDLEAAFSAELAAESAQAKLQPLAEPAILDREQLLADGWRFFRLTLDAPLQIQRIQATLDRAGFPDALVFDADLTEAIREALKAPNLVPNPNLSEVKSFQTAAVVVKVMEKDVARARKEITHAFAAFEPFRSINTIGEKVSAEMKTKAFLAVIFSCIAIIFYIWFRFGEVKFGLAAVIALIHDVLMTAAAVGVADALSGSPVGRFLGFSDIKLNVTMIAAFLTLIGYSINDTIVVFDRIRENMGGVRRRVDAAMVDVSVNQVLSRTILTSMTTLMVLVVLYLVGGSVVHGFAFVMTFGVLVGTYSSIFIASPVLIGWETMMAGLRKIGRIVTFR